MKSTSNGLRRVMSLSLMGILFLSTSFFATNVQAVDFDPIVDGDVLPLGAEGTSPVDDPDWDMAQDGLVVERGDGYIEICLPRTDDPATTSTTEMAGIHGTMLLQDAEITAVKDWITIDVHDTEPTISDITADGYHALYGIENGDDGDYDIIDTAGQDEVDFDVNGNWLEFWFATTNARDCVRVSVEYTGNRASMQFIYEDGHDIEDTENLNVAGTDYPYGTWIPLLEFSDEHYELGFYNWNDDYRRASTGVKYWYGDSDNDGIADKLYLEFHVTYFVKQDHGLYWLGFFGLDDGLTCVDACNSDQEGNYELVDVWGKIFLKGPYSDSDYWWDLAINEGGGSGMMFHGDYGWLGSEAGYESADTVIFGDIEPGSEENQSQGSADLQQGMKLLWTARYSVDLTYGGDGFASDIYYHVPTVDGGSQDWDGAAHLIGSISV